MKNLDTDLKGELERKFIHIITGLAYIPLIYLSGDFAFEILVLIAFLYFLIILILAVLKKINYKPVFEMIERWGRRKEEYIPFKPTLLLHTGITISLLLFPLNIVYASVAITALGDGIATISGKWIGRHKLPYSKRKTFEGTIAGVAAAFSGALLFVSPVQALLGSCGAILLESLIGRDIETSSTTRKLINLLKNDNLVLPIFSGFLMLLSGRMIQ